MKRLLTAAAGTLLAVGALTAVVSPAQASGPPCSLAEYPGKSFIPGSSYSFNGVDVRRCVSYPYVPWEAAYTCAAGTHAVNGTPYPSGYQDWWKIDATCVAD